MQAPVSYREDADIETASDDYAKRFAGEVGCYFLDEQLRITLKLLQGYTSPAILDVGGGHAQLAVPLVEKGYGVTVTGSDDVCEERLARQLPPGSYEYRTCDMLALPFAENSFDVVMAFRLLPHTVRWQALIGELARVARYGVIVDYPDIRSTNILNFLLFRVKKSFEGNTRPFTLFSRSQIAREFARNTFSAEGFYPEFFLPMVVHRKIGSARFSRTSETVFRRMGATHCGGSPIIAHFRKAGAP